MAAGKRAGRPAGRRPPGPIRKATPASDGGKPASQLIDAMIADEGGWKAATMAQLRAWIREADPLMVEEVKWRKPSNPAGVPVWSHGGIVCTGGFLKSAVRITFANGAKLDGATDLYNACLEGNAMRAIDLREGEAVDKAAFKKLVRAAVALNPSEK